MIVATHDGKHIAVPEYTRRVAVMLHNPPLEKEILQIASGAEDNVENSVKEVEADD